MTILDALKECIRNPGRIAAQYESYEEVGAIMYRDDQWYERSFDGKGGMEWNPLGPLFIPDELIDADGEPREYVLLPVARVEAIR